MFIVRAEDRNLGSVQKNETVIYQGPKCPTVETELKVTQSALDVPFVKD